MLFLKECKKVVKSLTFWIYCITLGLMFFTNYFSDCSDPATITGDEYKVVEDHELIMDGAVNSLMGEFASNVYICYPYGFYKSVSLKDSKKDQIEKYLQELMHTDHDGLMELMKEGQVNYVYHGMSETPEYVFDTMFVDKSVSYERFTQIMAEVDDILGGGSNYAVDSLMYNYSRVPMTKEDIAQEYDDFYEKDRITRSLARYFSDYAGIDLAFLPVFVAAVFTAADRRRRMTELVYSRKISSARLTFTRFAALVITMFIPVLITMVISFIQALHVYQGEDMDMTVMFTLPTFWLLPNIMICTATGMLLTEFFSAGVAIIVQFAWSFRSLMASSAALYGEIDRFVLICRHNTLGGRDIFMHTFDAFVFNRIFYMVLSLAAVCIAAIVYNMKRGGRFNGIRLFGEGGILRRKA